MKPVIMPHQTRNFMQGYPYASPPQQVDSHAPVRPGARVRTRDKPDGNNVLLRPLPKLHYPESLPVSARRAEIAAALRAHPVVIVAGETGSGKTTQLPKICLEIGRGRERMIGHTQPRRLAATSVARRIAEELQTELGDWVGYQIRFSDKTRRETAVKVMTDGILLAESQRDAQLSRYDTIIIDEAHERSLNIDFLLGFLYQLLARRHDLKLIITSATLDAQRFSRHFAMHGKPAPVIEVSGRSYPVQLRYRPVLRDVLTEDAHAPAQCANPSQTRVQAGSQTRSRRDAQRDLTDAVVDGVDECINIGSGDILVFLPGEREIRECADALKQRADGRAQGLDVLALYARLSQAEQDRIFRPQSQIRRVVLATNVAETSLTVPGIRFVIDSGLARVKRYSIRNKIEQLRIEAISQASAQQRAGRCGRTGPGVCIRLYDETDFKMRPAFTDPEILRSSLAAVILRMKSLGLQDVAAFPFVDAPSGRAIADGHHLLQELGALQDDGTLSSVGHTLARLPVDPRIARMILAAHEQQCLEEVLVIAAALSVQDPREQPLAERDAAQAAQARFRDDKSEFLSYLKLWRWCTQAWQERQSQRKFAEQLRQAYVSPLRFREWRDVHTQLHELVREQRWRVNTSPATYEQVHCALLAGLLGNLGVKSEEGSTYLGARDVRLQIHPGSPLVRKAGRWIMAAELMETTRLYARCVARIEPAWVERAGAHLLRKSWSDPRWEKKAGQVVALERGTLYGLTVYSGRRVHYGPIDPKLARELFIRHALIEGQIDVAPAFLEHNRKLIASIETLEHQARRPDILVDDSLIAAFYDEKIPQDIYQTASLRTWLRRLDKTQAQALLLTRDALMRRQIDGITTQVFPRTVVWQGVEMPLDYHFEPGSLRDGVTLGVPLFALKTIDPVACEWLVPGMLKEKVLWLLKSLPQKLRRHCVPLPDYAAAFHARWFAHASQPSMRLTDALCDDIWDQCQVRVAPADFKPETLPAHLFMNFKVLDEHGRMLAGGRNLEQLKAEYGGQAQTSFQQVAQRDAQVAQALAHTNLKSWSFGELPQTLRVQRQGQTLSGYPALIDDGSSCHLDVFDDADEAHRHHRLGLRRLFRLALREQVRYLEKNLPDFTRMSLLYMRLGTQEELRTQIIDAALETVCMQDPWPQDAAAFQARCDAGRTRLNLIAQEMTRLVGETLTQWEAAQKALPQAKPFAASHADITQQLQALVGKWFVRDTPYGQLKHFPRYLKAVQIRITRLRADPARDGRHLRETAPLFAQYQRTLTARKGAQDAALSEFRWLLEELRVSLYAQELRTPMPVSVKRLQKAWAAQQR